ncbi:MAG: helix-turn-helix domain-containing protein [Oligoflexus sp.]
MEIQTTEQFIDAIRTIRKKQKISQQQLADFTGLQRIGIVRIESGKTEPKLSTVLKMCQMLGIKVHVSFEGET